MCAQAATLLSIRLAVKCHSLARSIESGLHLRQSLPDLTRLWCGIVSASPVINVSFQMALFFM